MSAHEIAVELEAMTDADLYAVLAGLCSRHLDTVRAYAGFEIEAREMAVPDEQLPLLVEVA